MNLIRCPHRTISSRMCVWSHSITVILEETPRKTVSLALAWVKLWQPKSSQICDEVLTRCHIVIYCRYRDPNWVAPKKVGNVMLTCWNSLKSDQSPFSFRKKQILTQFWVKQTRRTHPAGAAEAWKCPDSLRMIQKPQNRLHNCHNWRWFPYHFRMLNQF